MNFKQIRVSDIPCLDFLVESGVNLYVGPRLNWWQRRRLKKVASEYDVIYLYDILKGITSEKLSYNFPGVTFPKNFSAETIFRSIRESIKEETGIEIDPATKFFIRFDGSDFVFFEGATDLKSAIECLEQSGDCIVECKRCFSESVESAMEYNPREICELPDEKECSVRFRVTSCDDVPGDFLSAKPFLESRDRPDPDQVKSSVQKLLMSGFPVEIILSWLNEKVLLSRLRITRQFSIVLVDYDKVVKMGPLPKTLFLFYLRHPEGVSFPYLQDHANELRMIYGYLSKNDDPAKMEESIANLVNPESNSASEKVNAIKTAFQAQIKDEIAKHYYVRGVQGGKKGIALNRDLVEWECEL